jgi:hypothetical protein
VRARAEGISVHAAQTGVLGDLAIKGWRENDESHYPVYEVAGDAMNGATVDTDTCVTSGPGFTSLCGVWTDPDFDAAEHAFYYARIVENPTCRWSAYECNRLAPVDHPASCSDPAWPKTIQERFGIAMARKHDCGGEVRERRGSTGRPRRQGGRGRQFAEVEVGEGRDELDTRRRSAVKIPCSPPLLGETTGT